MNTSYKTHKIYQERIAKVKAYINDNLFESLNIKTLAGIACISEYHFHRIFRAFTGEPLISYIIRLRIESAAMLLLTSDKSITEIAEKTGFELASSFNKAFKKRFGISPGAFRKTMDDATHYYSKIKKLKNRNIMKLKADIRSIQTITVIYAERTGPYYISAEAAWNAVCAWAGPKGLMNHSTEFIGISLDDPHLTDADKLRYHACLTMDKSVNTSGDVLQKDIAGGKYAVFTVKGSYNLLQSAYDYIFGEWLASDEYKIREEPVFEKYLNSPEEVPEDELLTEIWVPIV
jgi:AraC family transcriptional regulator